MDCNNYIGCIDGYVFFTDPNNNWIGIIPMNYIDVFLEALAAERGRSEKTLIGYASDLTHADAALPNGLLGATESDIQTYLSKLPDRASSIARKASALRGFYKFLMLEKIIKTNPTKNL